MNTQKNKITLLNDELIPLSECNYNRVSESQKREQEHQNDFREFGYKNPSVSEISFVKRRIRLIEEVIKESDKTADDIAGEEMDGMEFINGIMTKTKFGTAADLSSWERELEFLELKKESLINPALQLKESKEKPKPLTLKEFFNKEVPDQIIQKIQSDFKNIKGKKLAFLIYLLHKTHKLINYSPNSKTEARKHFIIALTGETNIVAGVDKNFNLNDVTLENPKFESDSDYTTIKEKLAKAVNKIVV